jgi:hypothetical protein
MQSEGIKLINCSIVTAKYSVMANEFNCLNAANSWCRNDFYKYCFGITLDSRLNSVVDSSLLINKGGVVEFYRSHDIREFTRNKEILRWYRELYPDEVFKLDNIFNFAKLLRGSVIVTDSKRLLKMFQNFGVVVLPKSIKRFGYDFSIDDKVFYIIYL